MSPVDGKTGGQAPAAEKDGAEKGQEDNENSSGDAAAAAAAAAAAEGEQNGATEEESPAFEADTAEPLPESCSAKAVSTRDYLEASLVPLLIAGMNRLARERPSDPIEYMAAYLLANNPNKIGGEIA